MTQTLQKPDAISSRLPDVGLFVECLATRNNLEMHGAWIDLTLLTEAADFTACINFILATSPQPNAEEWEVTDNTCPTFLLGKPAQDIVDWVHEYDSFSGDEDTQYAFECYCSERNQLLTRQDFEDAFLGFYRDEADFAWHRADERGGVPADLEAYIDWERLWEGEYECNGYTSIDVYRSHRPGLMQARSNSDVAIFRPA